MKGIVKRIGCSSLVIARKFRGVGAVVAVVGLGSLSAFATEDPLMPATDLVTAFTSNTTGYINAMVPVVLGIFGLMLGLGILMGWGKRAAH